ncbi:signal recognition particle-docking protein FtsY [Chroococcidiopsis sp. FACHB-1243]|uniref:signal recognition particle-docking protein FtsY n=1 Tax=Chroococcidiopsis sp. [FACHB-1243] TaxID=2692781 RepID=UPI0017834265|nr:signal recognition particle-docking protein FtsY [Chroococcidiopsis sp. [FACHB-1243]]MBD2308386.1 signal recognition particle-docking protein FtsY [Chroococcidiopsis sp. [FACHB-1243]]
MPFNWFRRKHDESSTPQEEQPATPAPEQPADVSQEQPAQDAAVDYLSFAKAAYKSIQERQQQAPEKRAEEAEGAEEAAELAASEAEALDTQVERLVKTEEPVTAETATLAEPISTEEIAGTEASAIAEETTTAETPIEATVPEEIAVEEIAAEETIPEETASVPFWARAETERQARLERLKATAIEEPESEVLQPVTATEVTATTADTDLAPDFAFDEGFLWSAEVLAAQGRRPEDISLEEITWLKKLRQGLGKTRRNIVNQLKSIVGQGPLNQAAVMEIEALLLQADVGVEATDYIIEALQNQIKQAALPPDAAIAYLKKILRDMLDRPLQNCSPVFVPEKDKLNIWLITGVNGAGKTTTIGKLAHIAHKSGYNCLIGAADTFRAAAVEQVKVWGARSNVEVIANPGKNTDPAAVVFDAIAAAQARNTELLLVDTAGRLQNKKNLMDELSKIRRIVDKKASDARVESLLVLDATLGQNGLRQAEVFAQAAQLSGVVLTKLDGTAKGGVALAVVQQLNLPIRFIGAGEGIEDLRPFSSYEFVEALIGT